MLTRNPLGDLKTLTGENTLIRSSLNMIRKLYLSRREQCIQGLLRMGNSLKAIPPRDYI